MTDGSDVFSIIVVRSAPALQVRLGRELDLGAEPTSVEAFTQAMNDNADLTEADLDVTEVESSTPGVCDRCFVAETSPPHVAST